MPQLRDSGNHSTAPLDAHTKDEIQSFARIFGIETEYGVSVTGSDRPCDAGQTAMMMFQPIVAEARSTNTYIENGSRLYLDVGSHPEYATAEARDPMDALALDAAGELVMRDLAWTPNVVCAPSREPAPRSMCSKTMWIPPGIPSAAMRITVRRFVPLKTIEQELLPFLITRQLFTGAGRMGEQGFQITQRADFLDEAVSSATTRSRPMVNTRDEPHADPDAFRRLHVIIGDSNRSQWATMMKLATTHLVLCVIEQAGREGKDSGFARFSFADASAANHKVSRDLTGVEASFDMADGTAMEGGAVAIQERYLEIVERFVGQHPEVCSSLPRTDVHEVIRQWRRVIEAFRSGLAKRSPTRSIGLPNDGCSTCSATVRGADSPSASWNSWTWTTMTWPTARCTPRCAVAEPCARWSTSHKHMRSSMFLPTIPAPHCVDGSSSRHDRTTRNIPVIGRDYR